MHQFLYVHQLCAGILVTARLVLFAGSEKDFIQTMSNKWAEYRSIPLFTLARSF